MNRLLILLLIIISQSCTENRSPTYFLVNNDIIPIKVYMVASDDLNYLKGFESSFNPALANQTITIKEESQYVTDYNSSSSNYILFGIIDSTNQFNFLVFKGSCELFLGQNCFIYIYFKMNEIYLSENPDDNDFAKELLVYTSGGVN